MTFEEKMMLFKNAIKTENDYYKYREAIFDTIGEEFEKRYEKMFMEQLEELVDNLAPSKSDLEIAKGIIEDFLPKAQYGIFDCQNIAGDTMCPLYRSETLNIDICYDYEYFEVFGLSSDDFNKLSDFYYDLLLTDWDRKKKNDDSSSV